MWSRVHCSEFGTRLLSRCLIFLRKPANILIEEQRLWIGSEKSRTCSSMEKNPKPQQHLYREKYIGISHASLRFSFIWDNVYHTHVYHAILKVPTQVMCYVFSKRCHNIITWLWAQICNILRIFDLRANGQRTCSAKHTLFPSIQTELKISQTIFLLQARSRAYIFISLLFYLFSSLKWIVFNPNYQTADPRTTGQWLGNNYIFFWRALSHVQCHAQSISSE